MKIEVNKVEAKKFEPIKLTITIESQAEYDALYHRMNAPDKTFENYCGYNLKYEVFNGKESILKLWKAIDSAGTVTPYSIKY